MTKRNVLAGLFVGLLSAVAVPAAAQELPRTQLKAIGPWINITQWRTVFQPFFTKTITELSGGRVTADVVSATELGLKGPEIFRLATLGVADLILGPMQYASGDLPEADGFDLAGLAQDIEDLRRVINVYSPVLEKQLDGKYGVVPVSYYPVANQIFWCSTPVKGLSDLRGKKLRVFSATTSDFAEAVGATPVTLSFGEVPTALQRKVVDCAITGANSGNLAKWTDVATHVYPLTVAWSIHTMVANKRSWQKLDPKVRELLLDKSNSVMAADGWKIAAESADHGVWCSVGDARCNPDIVPGEKMVKANLTLVEVTDADRQEMKKILASTILPRFAKRCGPACTAEWNRTAGAAMGVEAKAQ